MTTVARPSSPALQRISAAAFTRHCLLAVLEGLNVLRTESQPSEKHANTAKQPTQHGGGELSRPERDWGRTHRRPPSAPWGHSNRSIFSTKAWTEARTPQGPPWKRKSHTRQRPETRWEGWLGVSAGAASSGQPCSARSRISGRASLRRWRPDSSTPEGSIWERSPGKRLSAPEGGLAEGKLKAGGRVRQRLRRWHPPGPGTGPWGGHRSWGPQRVSARTPGRALADRPQKYHLKTIICQFGPVKNKTSGSPTWTVLTQNHLRHLQLRHLWSMSDSGGQTVNTNLY